MAVISSQPTAPIPVAKEVSKPGPALALTPAQIAIVKSTVPILKEHCTTITTLFYRNMLEGEPELKNVFSLRHQQSGDQQKALANAVLAYATYIDDLPKLKYAVEHIAQRHASLNIQAEQYAIVGKYLMGAIGEVLGDGLTPEVAEAWTLAYAQLANIFIGREGELYRQAGPWTGWRKFTVRRRVPESSCVTSFYLAPSDGVLPLPYYLPGQYISLRLPVTALGGIFQTRQYSLSDSPSREVYRISVKREDGETTDVENRVGHPGQISNLLHENYQVGDEIELSYPRGDFYLDAADTSKAAAPLVLLSAGVGATPLMSILNTVLSPESRTAQRPIRWIHSARDSGRLVFGKHVRALAAERSNVTAHVFVDEVKNGDKQGDDYDFGNTRVDLALLGPGVLGLGDADSQYFVCGPRAWMLAVRDQLEHLGVARESIKMELFGTGEVEQ